MVFRTEQQGKLNNSSEGRLIKQITERFPFHNKLTSMTLDRLQSLKLDREI